MTPAGVSKEMAPIPRPAILFAKRRTSALSCRTFPLLPPSGIKVGRIRTAAIWPHFFRATNPIGAYSARGGHKVLSFGCASDECRLRDCTHHGPKSFPRGGPFILVKLALGFRLAYSIHEAN